MTKRIKLANGNEIKNIPGEEIRGIDELKTHKEIVNISDVIDEVYGIHQYHDQYGNCKGKGCETCKVLKAIENYLHFEDGVSEETWGKLIN